MNANINEQPEAYSAHMSTSSFSLGLKKGGLFVCALFYYGLFLSNSKPTMAIAIMIAMVLKAKYISVGGKVTSGYGDAVGAAESTAKLVSANDGQYDSDPLKVAVTVYLPSMSGVHW